MNAFEFAREATHKGYSLRDGLAMALAKGLEDPYNEGRGFIDTYDRMNQGAAQQAADRLRLRREADAAADRLLRTNLRHEREQHRPKAKGQ